MSSKDTTITGAKTISKWQIPRIVKDYCESTSLHGYSYLYINNSILGKIFWATVILITTGLAVTCLVINTRAFMKATIATDIESNYENLRVSISCLIIVICSSLEHLFHRRLCFHL